MPKQDFTQIAKSIIDKVTGNAPPEKPDKRNPHAVALSKLGSSKGGKARAKNLSAKKRKQIAKIAARSRWVKDNISHNPIGKTLDLTPFHTHVSS